MTTPPVPGSSAVTTAGAVAARSPRGPAGRAVLFIYLPGAAGVAYLVAWLAGLAAWPSNLPLNATAAQTTASYAAHPAQAAVQYLLVEGLAGLLLGVVLGCVLLPRIRAGAGLRATGATVFGAVAVGLSLVQCALGLILVSAATSHDVARCGNLSNLVNQLDGAKMLALAATAALLAALGGPDRALPRWLRVVAVLLGVALIASGCAYLALSQSLAWTAYLSGPLLLLWVTSRGITQTLRERAARLLPVAGGAVAERRGDGCLAPHHRVGQLADALDPDPDLVPRLQRERQLGHQAGAGGQDHPGRELVLAQQPAGQLVDPAVQP